MCTCLLVLQVRSGTPQDHETRHPGDPNYKNVKAVDLAVRTAGQAVYAVESGECQAAEHPLCQLWQTLPCTISAHYFHFCGDIMINSMVTESDSSTHQC